MHIFREKNFRFLLLVTLIVGISYGICIPKLSFYGDDWIYIYNYHIAGEKSFTLFTQWDRPYSAWIYILTSAAFGEGPLGYNLYVLLMRWLAVFLFSSLDISQLFDLLLEEGYFICRREILLFRFCCPSF